MGAYRSALRRPASADFYDAVLDTQGLIKSALLASQAQGEKLGHAADSAREPFAARFYDRSFSIPKNLHAVERNRRLAAAALGYKIDDAGGTTPAGDALPLDYGIAAQPLAVPWLPKGEYAVLLTATSRADKEWPEEDWRALGTALIATGLRCVLPGGSPVERRRAARLAQSLGRAVAAPPMNLTDLAGLLAGASLVVGVDTGLVASGRRAGTPNARAVLRFRSVAHRRARHRAPCQSWRKRHAAECRSGGIRGPRTDRLRSMAARLIYTLVIYALLPWAVLHLLWRARRQPDYLRHWGERFGITGRVRQLPDLSGCTPSRSARHAPRSLW